MSRHRSALTLHPYAGTAEKLFSKAAEGKKLAEKRKKAANKEASEVEMDPTSCFQYAKLPFDLQEKILQYLPAREIGKTSAVSRAWNHIYQGAVASIFAHIVGVARGRSRLRRRAELELIHRLRHTKGDTENALEMLLWGCFNGYNEYVIHLLESKDNEIAVHHTGAEEWDGANALLVACRQGNTSLMSKLLEMGSNPNSTTLQQRTPLILAAENGYVDIVELLLKRKGSELNFNHVDSQGRTALFAACEKANYPIVCLLLDWARDKQLEDEIPELPIDINLGTEEMGSPFCAACQTGYTQIVKKLLCFGCKVNVTTKDQRTSLFVAAERGRINTVKLILKHRPPVLEKEMVECLARANRELTMEGALQMALTETEIPDLDPSMAGILADLANDSGKTPLFVASEKGNSQLVRILMEAQVSVSKPTYLNKTPLYAAAENGHTEVVRLLLTKSTRQDVLHQTNFGTTALFMAQRNGARAIEQLLTEFCVSKMTAEKALKKKDKGKQKKYMERLTAKKARKKTVKTNSKPHAEQDCSLSREERIEKEIQSSQKLLENMKDHITNVEETLNSLSIVTMKSVMSSKNPSFAKLYAGSDSSPSCSVSSVEGCNINSNPIKASVPES